MSCYLQLEPPGAVVSPNSIV